MELKSRRFILVLAMCIFIEIGLGSNANAATRVKTSESQGYVFKSGKTKLWSSPRMANAKLIGLSGNKKSVYFISKVVREHHKTFVRLGPTHMYWLKNKGMITRKFYVLRSSIRKIKTVKSKKRLNKLRFWVEDSKYSFWETPIGAKEKNFEQDFGKEYIDKNVYGTEQVKMYSGKVYVKAKDSKGKVIGWINKRSLKKGAYQDPVAYITSQQSYIENEWVDPKDSNIKVPPLIKGDELRKLVIQNKDKSATVIEFNGGPNTYYYMAANHKQTLRKEYQEPLKSKNLAKMDFSPLTAKTSITVQYVDEYGNKYKHTLVIGSNGQVLAITKKYPIGFAIS